MSKLTKKQISNILSSDMSAALSHIDNYSVPIGNDRGTLVDILAEKLELTTPIELYALDRIIFGQTDIDVELDYSTGYYDAQELTGIFINTKSVLVDKLIDFLKIKDFNHQVEWLLLNEYGYILDALKDSNYQIQVVDYSQLVFGAKDHYHNLDKDRVKKYQQRLKTSQLTVPILKGKTLMGSQMMSKPSDMLNIWQSEVPRGVVQYLPNSGMYRVVDGYHRLSASAEDEAVKVIVAS